MARTGAESASPTRFKTACSQYSETVLQNVRTPCCPFLQRRRNMIIGLGIDVTEISRIRKTLSRCGERFLARILTPEEVAIMPSANFQTGNISAAAIAYVAGRFAAKEALSKALGTGFSQGVQFTDFAILSLPSGAPYASLQGAALRILEEKGGGLVHISLSHGKETVAAVAILEKI